LILVRPELVEAMDPDQVPCCAPGLNSQTPDDCGLYWKGYVETPVQPYGRMGHGPEGYGPGPGFESAPMGPEGMGPGGIEPSPELVIPPDAPREEVPSSARLPARTGEVVVSDRPAASPAPTSSRRPAYAKPPAAAPPSAPYNPSNRQARQNVGPTNVGSEPPGFIGPIGYDVKN
jgi:pilus assembly protein CpaC